MTNQSERELKRTIGRTLLAADVKLSPARMKELIEDLTELLRQTAAQSPVDQVAFYERRQQEIIDKYATED